MDRMPIVFFGNCQSELLCAVYNKYVAPRTGKSGLQVKNYAALSPVEEEAVREAEVIVNQRLEFGPKVHWGHIPTRAKVVEVPLISGGFLWPFAGQPHPASERVDYLVYGPFGGELGDGYLNRLYQAKIPADTALAQYACLDIHKRIDLDRALELHLERQRHREQGTSIRIADFIDQNFRHEQLFHSAFHLALPLLKEYARQFLPSLGAKHDDIELMQRALTPGAHRHLVRPSVYMFETPIHPAVAQHYRLAWAPAGRKYRYFGESGLTFEEYVRRYVSFTWNSDLLEGISLVQQRRDKEGRGKLERGLARDPVSAEGHYYLGVLCLRREDTAGAAAAFCRAAELDADPHYPAIRGDVLNRVGDGAGATDCYRNALALDPADAECALRLAALLDASGDAAGATVVLRETLEFAPFSAKLWFELARLELASGITAAAEQDARRALELEPELAAARALVSEACAGQLKPAALSSVERRVPGNGSQRGSDLEIVTSRKEPQSHTQHTSVSMAKRRFHDKNARRNKKTGAQSKPPQPSMDAKNLGQDTAAQESDPPLSERISTATKLRDAGQFDDADRILLQASKDFDQAPAPAIEYARVAEARKNWEEANRRWQSVRERFDGNEAGFMGGILALRQLGDGETADELIAEATSKFPKHAWLLIQQAQRAGEREDWPAAEESWRACLASDPTGQWWVHAELARALAEQGNTTESEEVLLAGQALHPTEAGLLIEYARVAEKRKDWAEAERRWAQTRDRFPERALGFISGIVALREQGLTEAAERLLEEGATRFPDDFWFLSQRAETAMRERDWAAAEQCWRACLGISDGPWWVHAQLARCLAEQGKGDQAEAALAAGRQRFPTEPALTDEHARLAEQRSDWPAAEERWRDLLQKFPGRLAPYIGLAKALREQGRLEESDRILARAIERSGTDPQLVNYLHSAGWLKLYRPPARITVPKPAPLGKRSRRGLVLVRTHHIDEKFWHLFSELVTTPHRHYDVVALIDAEQLGDWAFPDHSILLLPDTFSKLSLLRPDSFRRLREEQNKPFGTLLWVAGDYALCAAQQQLPGYAYYVMVEYDVHFTRGPTALLDPLLEALLSRSGDGKIDAVGLCYMRLKAELGGGAPQTAWDKWTRDAERIFGEAHYTVFPFLAVSEAGVLHVLKERQLEVRRLALAADETEDDLPIICEAFVASALVAGGFHIVDLNDVLPGAYTRDGVWLAQQGGLPFTAKAARDESVLLLNQVYSEREFLRRNLISLRGSGAELARFLELLNSEPCRQIPADLKLQFATVATALQQAAA